MAGGHGVNRRLVMHNDFVIVGPAHGQPLFVPDAFLEVYP